MELSRVAALQRAEQNPLTGTNHIPGQMLHSADIQSQCQILQFLLQILGCIGHNQPIPGPGHGHIQHPHFLAEALGSRLGADGPF